MPTPVKVSVLEKLLANYEDKSFVISGFRHGFKVGYEGNHSSVFSSNAKTIVDNPLAAKEKLDAELKLGRISGPFKNPPFKNFKSTPLALRQKTNGNYRLLHNLSFPYNDDSVNLCIDQKHVKVTYASVADATSIILSMPGCYLLKSDIKDAFRLLPIHPADRHLLGFTFQNKFYYDNCLPMGCSSACKLFSRFTDSILFILKDKYKITKVVKYLDDFLFLGANKEDCIHAFNCFQEICNQTGIPIALDKTHGPSRVLTFLGYHIDTRNMIVAIPQTKLDEYSILLEQTLSNSHITLRELRSLIGKLVFVTSIINVGRCFLRRLIDLKIGKKHPATKIPLNNSAKEDIDLWLNFFKRFNGKSFIMTKPKLSSFSLHCYTDSCKTGYAGVFGKKFIVGSFPSQWQKLDIKVLELYPIFLLVKIFASKFANTSVVFHSDNETIVHVINSQTSKDKTIMKLLRPMILTFLNYNISFTAMHIPGKLNILSDRLSRGQVSKIFLQRHGMDPVPVTVPMHLLPVNFQI